MRFEVGITLLSAAALAVVSGCGDKPRARTPSPNLDVVASLRQKAGTEDTADPAAAAGMDQADGWGTVRGRFVYGGSPPSPQAVAITKDVQFCGQHQILAESLVVSSDGGLKNAVLFMRTRNPKVHESYAEKITQPVVFDNRDCRFEPHVLLIHTQQPVQILNSDPVAHNTSVQFQRNASFSTGVASNQRVTQVMDTAETYPAPAACNVHPWMGGWMLVKDNPYMAVSAADGSFVIENLPAGVELEFQVWHESGAGANGTVEGSGPVANVRSGRLQFTVPKDGELDLQDITLPPGSFR